MADISSELQSRLLETAFKDMEVHLNRAFDLIPRGEETKELMEEFALAVTAMVYLGFRLGYVPPEDMKEIRDELEKRANQEQGKNNG